jgi:hypothetical protein
MICGNTKRFFLFGEKVGVAPAFFISPSPTPTLPPAGNNDGGEDNSKAAEQRVCSAAFVLVGLNGN